MSEVQTDNKYHLPYIYNNSRVVLMARDPNCLFAYWELSGDSKDSFIREFGAELWEKTVPVLKVTNVSDNNSFYVRVNDFSNSWYINVPDSGSLYVAEIGRRLSDKFFINLASSNYVTTPSNALSPNTTSHFINYSDLKGGSIDLQTGMIYKNQDFVMESQLVLGLSSPELLKNRMDESILGISSAQLFGINLEDHLGISSEILIR